MTYICKYYISIFSIWLQWQDSVMIQIRENLRRTLSPISVLIRNAGGKMEEWGTNFRENESEHWGKIFLIATFKKYQFFKNILRLDFFYIMSKEHLVYHEKKLHRSTYLLGVKQYIDLNWYINSMINDPIDWCKVKRLYSYRRYC